MKQIIQLLFLTLLLVVGACSTTQDGAFIKGTVEEIQQGKDGYTAKIRTDDNEVFFATISHANLTNPAQYKTVEVGSVIEVKGDNWEMGEDKQITVRELK